MELLQNMDSILYVTYNRVSEDVVGEVNAGVTTACIRYPLR